MAAVRQQRLDDAATHLAELSKLAADPVLATMLVWDRYPLSHAVRIAEKTLAAEVALAKKDPATAIAALREAVTIEDKIPYDEPPGWHAPTRHALGAALLSAGNAADAEAVYREELLRNPANGWSLFGLAASLEAQKKDSAKVREELGLAWQNADVKLSASHN